MGDQADYQAYLQTVFPGTTWTTARLTGGIVNSTLRATQTSKDKSSAPQSLIVKHAHPYIESAGPEFTFSTERQAVEAAILSLWDENGLLYSLRQTVPAWKTPRLLRHQEDKESTLTLSPSDQRASIILLSDLGQLINMVQFLKACAKDSTIATDAQITSLGTNMGTVMAMVHSEETYNIVMADEEKRKVLTHKLTGDIVWQLAVEPIKERIAHVPNADKLYQSVVDEYKNPKYSYRHALSVGDFHPGSILMKAPESSSDGNKIDLTPTLLDWEFGGINGRGVNGDIAQFLSSFHCELIKAKDDAAVLEKLTLFVRAFCDGYRERAKLLYKQDASDDNVHLMRSAFSLHGRELINLANDEHDKNADMVAKGIWYLERSGQTAEEFVDEANWAQLKDEDLLMIQSLFIKS